MTELLAEQRVSDAEARTDVDEPPAPRARAGVTKAQARARAGRLLVVALVLAAAVASVVVAGDGLADAEAESEALASERSGAAAARADVEGTEAERLAQQVDVDDLRAVAGEAREEQRARLREIGLTEFTIDRFLERIQGNTELVEWQRDGVTAAVDRQAQEIPELERCLVAARQAVNSAFNRSNDPNVVVPTPTEVCLALLVPPDP